MVSAAMRDMLAGQSVPVAVAPEPVGPRASPLESALRDDMPIDHPEAALVVATSGSSGQPQGVLLSASRLIAAADLGTAALGGPGLWLAAVPVTGIGGIIAVLRSVRSGQEPIALAGVGGAAPFAAAAFTEQALQTVRQARAIGVPAYVSLVPTQLRRLIAAGGAALDALAGFGAVLVGGSAMRSEDRARTQAHGVRLIQTYGATETGGGVLYDGTPLAGVGVAFHDQETGRISADGPGRIVIDGPTLALGYRLRPDLTEEVFRSDGYHSPDLGQMVPGGIAIDSRVDQIVKVGGVKVSLPAVTRALCDHRRVVDALTIAEDDPEWGSVPISLVVADNADRDRGLLHEELRQLIAERLGRASTPRRIDFVEELPVGHTGKVVR